MDIGDSTRNLKLFNNLAINNNTIYKWNNKAKNLSNSIFRVK